MKIWTIDRIDVPSNIVTLTDDSGKSITVSGELFDTMPKEGDVINISVDKDETASRLKQVNALMDELFE